VINYKFYFKIKNCKVFFQNYERVCLANEDAEYFWKLINKISSLISLYLNVNSNN